MINLPRGVKILFLFFLVVMLLLPTEDNLAQGPLLSDYFGNDPIALDIAAGIITDYTFSGTSPSNIQYKILSAFRMLDYSYEDWASPSRLQTFRTAFQRSHGIAETDFITGEFMFLLDGEMYAHEQMMQAYIVDFPIDESFSFGGQNIEYVPVDPNEPTKDHIRYFLSFVLGSLPRRIAPLTLENVYYFFRYQSFGIIEYDGGWTLDYMRGIYWPTSTTPAQTHNVSQTLHEYGHQIDGRLYGHLTPDVGMVNTQGFYEILFDMEDTRTGVYGTYATYLHEARLVSQYADGWEHPQYPGYFSVVESFAESFTLYITQGKLYRALTILDQNYAQQYNWLKDNVFSTIEYDTGSESCISHVWPVSWDYAANQLPSNTSDTLQYCHVPASTSFDNPIFPLADYFTQIPMGIVELRAANDSPTNLGQPTTLSATVAAGLDVSYSWVFGDGETGSGAEVSHQYPHTGVFLAEVTAVNPLSEAKTTTVVIVIDTPISGLSAVNDGPNELEQATTLTAAVTAGSNVSYSWAFGDGETGSGAAVTHQYPDVGEYTAVVTATNSMGTSTASTVVTVTDVPITGLSVINDGPNELGQPTTLTAAVTAGSNASYSWAFGDGEKGSGALVTHQYPDVGEYTAVVTATNSMGTSTASTVVTVTDMPITGLSAINDGPNELGQPTTLTAAVTAGSNASYSWVFGDGETGSGAVVTHQYPDVNEYTAVVTASNSMGVTTATTDVTVTDVPITGLSAINDGPTELGQATTLTATVAVGSNVSYSWAFGDGETGSGAVINHQYSDVGEYVAVVTATNSISTVTLTIPIRITSAPPRSHFLYLPARRCFWQ